MKTELIFGELSGGGGGTEHTIKVTLNHTGAYGTSITFTVSLDGTQAATKTITATNAGRNYDDNLDFTVDGKTLNMRVYATQPSGTSVLPIYYELTKNGATLLSSSYKGQADIGLAGTNEYTFTLAI